MTAVLAQALALGVGVAGALVDVTSFVKGPEGTTWQYGRKDEFRDPAPGVLSFTLENQDGRFTPGNASSPLATLLSEGTVVCWSCGGRLVQAQVTAIGFATSEDQWGRVQITCGDVFYIANRTPLGGLAGSMAEAQAYQYWPFTDRVGSGQAVEANGGESLIADPTFGPSPWVFGVAATGPAGDPQMSITGSASSGTIGTQNQLVHGGIGSGTPASFAPDVYPPGSNGAWGFWVTTSTVNDGFGLSVIVGFNGLLQLVYAGGISPTITLTRSNLTGPFTLTIPAALTPGVAHYLAFASTYSGTTFTTTVYLDGVAVGSRTYTAGSPDAATPFGLSMGTNSGTVSFSHLTHSPVLLHEEWAGVTSEANRFAAIAQTVPQMTVGIVDPALSSAPVGIAGSGSTAWSAICDLLRTEQGHIYSYTSGTLTAPSTVVNVRARTRPLLPAVTLDAQADIDGLPQFVRDITNLFATVTATGPATSATATDLSAAARVGSAGTSETVILQGSTDLLEYAQDRLIRGENVQLRVAQVSVDAVHASTAGIGPAILGLVPGDRVRITNLPTATTLGFVQWDGWFLGADEVHTPGALSSDKFTLYLAPVLPSLGSFDGNADRVNLSRNATLGVNATDWLGSGSGAVTSARTTGGVGSGPPLVGDSWLRVTASASETFMDARTQGVGVNPVQPATAGTVYTFSAYMRPTSAATCSPNMFIQWIDVNGSQISTSSSTGQPLVNVAWNRASVTDVAPQGAVRAVLVARAAGAFSAADRLDVTGFLFETGSTVGVFFDGDTAAGGGLTFEWDSTVDNSISYQLSSPSLFMSGGNNTLNASCTNVATTITVKALDGLTFMEGVAVGYSITIDAEQMTVNSAGAPVAGVQTLGVTRAQGGTTAAAHSAAAPVEISTTTLFAF